MTQRDAVLAIDQGTTSSRALVVDEAGEVVASAQLEHRQIFPQPGWVEHDTDEIWSNVQAVIRDAIAAAPGHRIRAVGVTNQRETTVVWDAATGRPVANAIVWQDTRSSDLVERLAADGGHDRFRAITGLPLASYFSATKVRWLFDTDPTLQERAERGELRIGTIDSWLIDRLTGGTEHVTDVTNASRTLLMDLRTLTWSAELCEVFDIPVATLPRILPSSSRFGEVTTIPALDGVPITGVLGDQQAAAFGQTAFEPGESKNTYGTGNFLLLNTGTELRQSQHGLVSTVAYQLDGEAPVYALEGSIAVSGSLVQWLRDGLGIIENAADIEALAATVPDSADVVVVPAFQGLLAPHWRADARGTIIGITRYTTKAHIARACLEAVAMQTVDVAMAMVEDSGRELRELRVDGGMSANNLLMDIQADLLGCAVVRPTYVETTALGAAFAAGLSIGLWPDLASLRALWQEDRRWTPTMDADQRSDVHLRWTDAVGRSFGWARPMRGLAVAATA
ncbi:glycerol kinase GlpK [Salinibacterium sp. ZJ454]|uniref:glycerol kinase GlpK n=1 Tax=Salinibacterium sp. ZJ454 TaxID=2708339 RepID=UPI00141FE8F3|nr:glycerol kinase GlpK [Salinibacterium sp. ZJ454]